MLCFCFARITSPQFAYGLLRVLLLHRFCLSKRNGILTCMNIAHASPANEPAQKLTLILRAISDPARRRILKILKEKKERPQDGPTGLCASDIEEKIKLSQPTISHHMAVLTKAGLVHSQKDGQWMWYQRNEKELRSFINSLRKNL